MSQTIAVPQEITRSAICDLVRSLGLDPMEITEDGLRITWDAVTCHVIAKDAKGEVFLDGDERAANTVVIRIVEDDEHD